MTLICVWMLSDNNYWTPIVVTFHSGGLITVINPLKLQLSLLLTFCPYTMQLLLLQQRAILIY